MQERDKEPLQERFFRPHFLQAPGDMVAHEGRLCRLDCKVCPSTRPVHILPLIISLHSFLFALFDGIFSQMEGSWGREGNCSLHRLSQRA